MKLRKLYDITGQVQGVGFRPFIFHEAVENHLTGYVINTMAGVHIEVQGLEEDLRKFGGFVDRLPALAVITSLTTMDSPIVSCELDFTIRSSSSSCSKQSSILVSPDVAPCRDCLNDMSNPNNPRFGYPFTNCTNCGPRYTITRELPYDRSMTSMSCFPMCDSCKTEFNSPQDRRFHAQPNACPVCGPSFWLNCSHEEELQQIFKNIRSQDPANLIQEMQKNSLDKELTGRTALLGVILLIRLGYIVAIKGVGGFQLVCDALNKDSVATLRIRKDRPHQALAVMVPSIEVAEEHINISSDTKEKLLSPQRPIVISPLKATSSLRNTLIAPDTDSVGIMLPSSPLHYLLFHPEWLGHSEMLFSPVIVMTSGNIHNSPICIKNREAVQKLFGIADAFLFHNRDILVRVDDSVVFSESRLPDGGGSQEYSAPSLMVRRARGYVPSPLIVSFPSKKNSCILGVGAELKHTFCISRGNEMFVSQHIGNLTNKDVFRFFEQTYNHLIKLLNVEPSLIVRDVHPNYLSRDFAESLAKEKKIPLKTLQHHAAHIFAVMAEYKICTPVLGMVLDGAGYGEDGSIWGGELFVVHEAAWERIGRFSPFALPGGDSASLSPWKIAESLLYSAGVNIDSKPWREEKSLSFVQEMLAAKIHCPLTSSCGRLFDAVSALCGLCSNITYEGQAAIRLEACQDWLAKGEYSMAINRRNGLLEPDVVELFQGAVKDRNNAGVMSRRFHRALITGLTNWVALGAEQTGIKDIILSGGVFNNRTLRGGVLHNLLQRGLHPILPKEFSCGDASISLGQVYWAMLNDNSET